jgi:two-component system OmpR family sensor kinase
MNRRLSLRAGLTLWYAAVLGVILAVAGAYIYRSMAGNNLRALDENLLEISRRAFQNWLSSREMPEDKHWPEAIRRTEWDFALLRPRIRAISFPDAHVPDKAPTIYHAVYPEDAAPTFSVDFYNRMITRDEETPYFLTRTLPALSPRPMRVLIDPNHDVLIEVAVSLDKMAAGQRGLFWSLLLAGALVLLLASLGGGVILRRALRPVREAVATTRRITAGDLSLRLQESGRRDEIGELVATLNGMLQRLDEAVQQLRRFSGDVSHELRTPLTVIRGEIEIALRRRRGSGDYRVCLRSILEESSRLEKIIADLLLLSSFEEMSPGAFHGDVALDEVALQVFELREKVARARKVRLGIGKLTPLRVRGEAGLLQQLLLNLVDNAIRYTPGGGQVKISLKKQGDMAVLSVLDNGAGIPDAALPHIFERFFVAEPSRNKAASGVGLGLAIVKWIAESHHARIGVQSRKGRGSVFTVAFPLPAPAPAAEQGE